MSPQGQELNLANISLARPVTIKQAVKTITTPSSISVVQPKQVVMKKVIAPANKAMIPRTAVGKCHASSYEILSQNCIELTDSYLHFSSW